MVLEVKLSQNKDVEGLGAYHTSHCLNKTRRIAMLVAKIALYVLFASASIAINALSILFLPILGITIPLSLGGIGFSGFQLFKLVQELKGLKTISPPTSTLPYAKREQKCPSLDQYDDKIKDCYVFEDTLETYKAKHDLIKNAEQEILLSGSYCGKEALDETLDLIEERMKEKPNLRVCILSSTRFLSNNKCQNWEKLEKLTRAYPDRFHVAFSFETVQANPTENGFKFISNHVKLMVVDGRAMITGGSGIEDRWAKSDGLKGLPSLKKVKGYVNRSIAKCFRDKDFLFYSTEKNSNIERSRLEFYKLFTRWHHYTMEHESKNKYIGKIIKAREEALVQMGKPVPENFHDFHKTLVKNEKRLQLEDLGLDETRHTNDPDMKVKLHVSGPEQTVNKFEKDLIELFDNAQKSITFSHMYFHPTPDVAIAMKNAIRRGVKFKILTNTYHKKSPYAHRLFTSRSAYHIRDLAREGAIYGNPLQLWHWTVKNSTNHQKIIVVDDQYLVCGSSNFGYKGLKSMSDYEHNVIIDSKKVCEKVNADFAVDTQIDYTKEANPLKNLSLIDLTVAGLHRFFSPIVG